MSITERPLRPRITPNNVRLSPRNSFGMTQLIAGLAKHFTTSALVGWGRRAGAAKALHGFHSFPNKNTTHWSCPLRPGSSLVQTTQQCPVCHQDDKISGRILASAPHISQAAAIAALQAECTGCSPWNRPFPCTSFPRFLYLENNF